MVSVKFLFAVTKAQSDEGGGRLLLSDNTRWADRFPVNPSLDLKMTHLRIEIKELTLCTLSILLHKIQLGRDLPKRNYCEIHDVSVCVL